MALLGLAGLAVTAFQLVPLPPALLKLFHGDYAEVIDVSLAPIGKAERWRPLSMSPIATTWEWVQLAIVVGGFFFLLYTVGFVLLVASGRM